MEARRASDTKVLVLFGSKDIYGPTVETLFARYPDAGHVVLENAGHLLWLQSQTHSVTSYARSSVVDMVALRQQSSEIVKHRMVTKNEKFESAQEAQS